MVPLSSLPVPAAGGPRGAECGGHGAPGLVSPPGARPGQRRRLAPRRAGTRSQRGPWPRHPVLRLWATAGRGQPGPPAPRAAPEQHYSGRRAWASQWCGPRLPGLSAGEHPSRPPRPRHHPEARATEDQRQPCPFQGVRVSETPKGVSSLDPSRGESINVEPGCSLPDPCDSNPCPANSYCSDDWDSYSCSCDPGGPGIQENGAGQQVPGPLLWCSQWREGGECGLKNIPGEGGN